MGGQRLDLTTIDQMEDEARNEAVRWDGKQFRYKWGINWVPRAVAVEVIATA